jgi:asparagine synthase (glutamine-hydrolysing)
MVHRGPDSGGVWACPTGAALLAHRRLAIIDLSARADQPLLDIDTGAAIVLNGEIYNYRELRRELESSGYRFRTASDTEVLLYGYLAWNTGVFERAEGMFALAVWDPRSRRLLLGRDFCGQKPLYYSHENGAIVFCSELRALAALRASSPALDPDGLEDYLRYWCVPAPGTLLKGVRKLAAGHYLEADADGCRTRRHWYPLAATSRWTGQAHSAPEWQELLAAELRRSVANTCVADVPIGVAFSGGSDSVAVAAAALETMPEVRTFSIDAPGGLDPEEKQLRERFARWAGVPHQSTLVPERQLREWIPSRLRAFDEPVSDNTVVFSTLLAGQFRAQGYKVFLTGEGGDEVFLGYPWWVRLIRWQQRLRSAARAARLTARLLPARLRAKAVGRMCERVVAGPDQMYWDSQLGLSLRARQALRNGNTPAHPHDFLERTRADFLAQGGTSESQWFTYLDLNLRLPEMLLLRLDRSAMLASTEARSPLLEKRLVELALAMPEAVKLQDHCPKAGFLEAVRRIVPAELVIGRKVGYNHSLRRLLPNLAKLMGRSVTEWNRSARLFPYEPLERLVSEADADVLWPLYAFSEWHAATFEGKRP